MTTTRKLLLGGLIAGLSASLIACEQSNTDDDENGSEGGGETGGGETGGGDEDESGEAGEGPGGGGSVEAQLCQRVQECGYMEPGYTVGDCTDIVQACTADLLTSAKADWDGWAGNCLDLNNCMNFGECYIGIDACTLYVEEGVGDSGDPTTTSATTAGDDGPGDSGDSCIEGDQFCASGSSIAVCADGVLWELECYDVCVENGWDDTVGCGYDDEVGADICWCL